MRRALITGITGQDGSYLAEFLVERGYQVHGLVRDAHRVDLGGIEPLRPVLRLVPGNLADQASLDAAILSVLPDEVYNLASQTSVPESWEDPVQTADVSGLGVARLLQAIRKYKPDARFYQASSSEIFGTPGEAPQTEDTPLRPRNPHGAAKVYAQHLTAAYRQRYGLFVSCGICFNHESPRRPARFISRKVSLGVARIRLGLAGELRLGNLDARRDWGYAPEYVEPMWTMLQQPEGDDYIIATGQSHSVRELVDIAFASVGLDWRHYVMVDETLRRPADRGLLVGNPAKAREKLGWRATTSFRAMVELMVEADLRALRDALAATPGHRIVT
jgi:GDPmannose 4,6-dehydratase